MQIDYWKLIIIDQFLLYSSTGIFPSGKEKVDRCYGDDHNTETPLLRFPGTVGKKIVLSFLALAYNE